jgi:hypothetical protein
VSAKTRTGKENLMAAGVAFFKWTDKGVQGYREE